MKGCVFGAFIGDAAGAVLEFENNITDQMVENAMKFPGGGYWRVGAYQITDDSEMAMCILHGLQDKGAPLNLDKITA